MGNMTITDGDVEKTKEKWIVADGNNALGTWQSITAMEHWKSESQ